jgi:hypothetical protein
VSRKTVERAIDDLDFYCQRLHCRMTEAACIDRQRKAYRMRTEMGAGKQHDGAIYDIALSCLVCADGEALRKRLGIPLTEKPRPAKKPPRVPKVKAKPKPKPKLKRKPAPKPPERVPVPLDERPLCSECGRWVARTKGLCMSCYQRHKREAQR